MDIREPGPDNALERLYVQLEEASRWASSHEWAPPVGVEIPAADLPTLVEELRQLLDRSNS